MSGICRVRGFALYRPMHCVACCILYCTVLYGTTTAMQANHGLDQADLVRLGQLELGFVLI